MEETANKIKEMYSKCKDEKGKVVDIVELILSGITEKQEEDMPKAAPLDLLSKKDYKRMNTYLTNKYGPLCQYIDENYVALLMALSEYEEVDFDVKICEHIAANVKAA